MKNLPHPVSEKNRNTQRKILLLLMVSLLALPGMLFSQGVAISKDNSNPHPSAVLELKSSSQGLLVPRMTAAQRDAIVSPATGLLLYVTDGANPGYYTYNGTQWILLATGTGASRWTESNGDIAITSGNVGIGTTSPASLLELSSASAAAPAAITFDKAGTDLFAAGVDTSNHFRIATGSDLSNNANTKMIIQQGGSVGLGTVSPAAVFHIQRNIATTFFRITSTELVGLNSNVLNINADGDIGLGNAPLFNSGAQLYLSRHGGSPAAIAVQNTHAQHAAKLLLKNETGAGMTLVTANTGLPAANGMAANNSYIFSDNPLHIETNTGNPIIFYTNNQEAMRIEHGRRLFATNGVSVQSESFTPLKINLATFEIQREVSTQNLKDNIRDISFNRDTFFMLKPRDFSWKPALGGKPGIGLVAEEVAGVLPQLAIFGYKEFYNSDGSPMLDSLGYQVRDTTQLVPVNIDFVKLTTYMLAVLKDYRDSIIKNNSLDIQQRDSLEALKGKINGLEAIKVASGGNIGIGTEFPEASAILTLESFSGGFLPPRMTTAQRNAIASPAPGLLIFNTEVKKHQGYDGTVWHDLY